MKKARNMLGKSVRHTKSLIGLMIWLVASAASAATTVFYFPSDYSGNSGSPANVTRQGEFAPICEDGSDIYTPRLPGLDMVRGFSGAVMCQLSDATTQTFATEAEYVFLVDDTGELSPYLLEQMRQKGALQTQSGREIIKPTVIEFPSEGERQGFKILVVGEESHGNRDEAAWFAAINQRFEQDQLVAGTRQSSGSDEDEIWFVYHGSYINKLNQVMENVSVEKIVEFFEKQLRELGAGSSAPPPATGATPSPPPLPQRQLNDYMTLCHNNFVPLPPVWNPQTGTNAWQKRGDLANPLIATGLSKVEVWTYESTSPQGICIALPRMTPPGNIDSDVRALGIICQSERTGKACFWDNVERPANAPDSGETDEAVRRPIDEPKILGAATQGMDPFNMRDGYNLNQNCAACHRGSNAFLIRYGTALSSSAHTPSASDPSPARARIDIDPSVRYAPLSGNPPSPAWNNRTSRTQPLIEAAVPNDSQCTMCHDISANNNQSNEIADLTSQYCILLGRFIGTDMPPGNSANWANGHLEEVRSLANQCCAIGVDIGLSAQGASLISGSCPPPSATGNP